MTRSREHNKGDPKGKTPKKATNKAPGKRISRGLLPLSKMVPGLARDTFRKRGFTETRVLTDWAAIVGPRLAQSCSPEKIVYGGHLGESGVLTLRIPGALATEIQHEEPRIIERINSHFGYRAVERLKLVHGTTRKKVKAAPHRPGIGKIDPDEAPLAPAAKALVEGIRDEGLKGALEKLGHAVAHTRGDKLPKK